MTPGSDRAPAKVAAAPAAAAPFPAGYGPESRCRAADTLAQTGRLAEARDALVECLNEHPAYYPGFVQLGKVLLEAGHDEPALACMRQATALAAGDPAVQIEIAGIWSRAGKHAHAAQAWAAVAEHTASAEVLNNLGLALAAAGDAAQAEQAYRAALVQTQLPEAHANLASLLQQQGRNAEALEHYRRAVSTRPAWPEAWNNLGMAARALDLHDEGVRAFERAIALRPDHVEAHYNLGNACAQVGDAERARGAYRAAVAHRPDHAQALHGLANLTADLAASIDLYRRALAAQPDFPEAQMALLGARLKACDWVGLDQAIQAVETLVSERPAAAIAPFTFLQASADPELQQRCSQNWVRARVAPRVSRLEPLPPLAPPAAGKRLRVGYLSGDFRDHAVGNLVADWFGAHDRTRVDVFGYSSGPDDASETRRRIVAGCDAFRDERGRPLREIAAHIRGDAIDILVDLSGFTDHGCTDVLALRPAHVQVSYLGFPGTTGAAFVDALLSDAVLTPAGAARWYEERLVLLPRGHQPTGTRLPASRAQPSRTALGLPADGFVFCCFNNSYKIRPHVFQAWMRILAAVPHGVLWLAEFNSLAQTNLREEAARCGIAPERLRFAPVVALGAHLERLPAADLFLDTFPYCAGATANHALSAGVPVLALTGEAYVSRMSASLLHSLGLAELAVSQLSDYEALAIALAHDPIRLAALRTRLRDAQAELHWFDPVQGARALEAAYRALWDAYRSGTLRASGSHVSPLRAEAA